MITVVVMPVPGSAVVRSTAAMKNLHRAYTWGMRTNPRRQSPPSWLAWWIGWAFLLFWPLCFGLVAVEVLWLVLVAGISWLAVTGRRRARR